MAYACLPSCYMSRCQAKNSPWWNSRWPLPSCSVATRWRAATNGMICSWWRTCCCAPGNPSSSSSLTGWLHNNTSTPRDTLVYISVLFDDTLSLNSFEKLYVRRHWHKMNTKTESCTKGKHTVHLFYGISREISKSNCRGSPLPNIIWRGEVLEQPLFVMQPNRISCGFNVFMRTEDAK